MNTNEKKCPICGAKFELRHKGAHRRFCSDACKMHAYRARRDGKSRHIVRGRIEGGKLHLIRSFTVQPPRYALPVIPDGEGRYLLPAVKI